MQAAKSRHAAGEGRGHLESCVPRGGPLERAAARVCREAGATVALNVRVRDLNLDAARQDERRIEVIANGLPIWGGTQVAVDTTLVSPLTAAGAPRREGGSAVGAALRIARKAKLRTYSEFARASRCRLAVIAIEVGGRWSLEAARFDGEPPALSELLAD